jgi:hypothetical protein
MTYSLWRIGKQPRDLPAWMCGHVSGSTFKDLGARGASRRRNWPTARVFIRPISAVSSEENAIRRFRSSNALPRRWVLISRIWCRGERRISAGWRLGAWEEQAAILSSSSKRWWECKVAAREAEIDAIGVRVRQRSCAAYEFDRDLQQRMKMVTDRGFEPTSSGEGTAIGMALRVAALRARFGDQYRFVPDCAHQACPRASTSI